MPVPVLVMPPSDAPLMVPGDADQLVQVFTNLVENGLKYGAAGQVLRGALFWIASYLLMGLVFFLFKA